jgi:hypothetical protein
MKDPFKGRSHMVGEVGKTACGLDASKVRVLPPRSSQHCDCKRCLAHVRRFARG